RKVISVAPAAAGLPGVSGSGSAQVLSTRLQAEFCCRHRRLRPERCMITVLTGGTGGAKFVDGLRRIVPPKELTVIVNTGDDHEWWGLYVSPDLDSITYMMAGILSPERGWGVRGDTFHCLQTMKELGEPSWFSVGDRDLAIHLLRTKLLSQGCSLSETTQTIAEKLRVHTCILPMSDHKIETRVQTPL